MTATTIAPPADRDDLLREALALRARLEDLRASGAALGERAQLRAELLRLHLARRAEEVR